MDNPSFKQIAMAMVARGFNVIPLMAKDKAPFLNGWNAINTKNPEIIDEWASGKFDRFDNPDGEEWTYLGRKYQNNGGLNGFFHDGNMSAGCVCTLGKGHLCVLDIDKDGVLAQIEAETGKQLPTTFTVQSRPEEAPYKRHYYFWQTDYSVTQLPKTVGAAVTDGRYDLKINGQTVAPGSLHTKTGKPYAIMTDAEVVDMPDWLVDWVYNDKAKYKVNKDGGESFQALDMGVLLPEGHRYPYLRSHAAKLRTAGCNSDQILDVLRQDCIDHCVGGLSYFDSHELQLKKLAEDIEEDIHPDAVVYMSDESEPKKCTMKWKPLSAVKPEVLEWLWPGRIALKGITAFSGDPGIGKTTFTLDMIARGSIGDQWIDGKENTIGEFETVLLSAEDDAAAVIVPRLSGMGANLDRILIPEPVLTPEGEREFSLDKDLQLVREQLETRPGIKLIVIDPLSNYCPTKNLNNEQEARSVLMPINRLCQKFNVAAVVIFHNSKQSGRAAIHKTIGAVGNVGSCRMGWSFQRNAMNTDNTLVLQMKENLGKFPGMEFTTVSKDVTVEGTVTSQASIQYVGEAQITADTNIAINEDPKFKQDQQIVSAINKIFGTKKQILGTVMNDGLNAYQINDLTKIGQAMQKLNISSQLLNGDMYWVKNA